MLPAVEQRRPPSGNSPGADLRAGQVGEHRRSACRASPRPRGRVRAGRGARRAAPWLRLSRTTSTPARSEGDERIVAVARRPEGGDDLRRDGSHPRLQDLRTASHTCLSSRSMELLLIRHALPVRRELVEGAADPELSEAGQRPGRAPRRVPRHRAARRRLRQPAAARRRDRRAGRRSSRARVVRSSTTSPSGIARRPSTCRSRS